MRKIVVSEFISLDGVVQAPGGAEEDTDGGFRHGGWSMPYFDPETMGAAIGEAMATTDALLFGRRTYQTMAAAWPERAGDEFADEHERDEEVRRVANVQRVRRDVAQHDAADRRDGDGRRPRG